jgi:hypothetical protein
MAKGTSSGKLSDRLPVKSAPPDGYVVLRRRTYGEKKKRDDMQVRMTVAAAEKQQQNGQLAQPEAMSMEINSLLVARYDFRTCVVEHNITDENDRLLDFSNPADLELMDEPVGEEIEKLIRDFNSPPDDLSQFRNEGGKISVLQQEIGGSSEPPAV